MRSFTAETREILHWFPLTHEVEAVGLGGAVWRLVRLPRAGGLGDQDARLMRALEHARGVANHLLARRRAEHDEARALAAWHDADVATRHKERTH